MNHQTASGTEMASTPIEKPSLVAGWTWPSDLRSQMKSGTNNVRPRTKTIVKPTSVGGAIGRRPIAGPMTVMMAALSMRRLCDWASRRFIQPWLISTAKGMMTASGTIVQVNGSVKGGWLARATCQTAAKYITGTIKIARPMVILPSCMWTACLRAEIS